jgi:membrane-bound lytic murein transglycosylase MltF
LRALFSADESPEAFSLKDDGPPGFDRELLEGFARLHDLRLQAVPVKRFAEMIPRLKAGEGDVITGIIDTEAVVDLTMAKKHDPALRAGAFVGAPASGAWGLRPSDTELKRALDDHLAASRRSGAWSRLVIRYYGQDALDVLGRER